MHFQATGRNVNCARFVHTKNCLDGCLRETKIARKRVYNVPEIKFAVAKHLTILETFVYRFVQRACMLCEWR